MRRRLVFVAVVCSGIIGFAGAPNRMPPELVRAEGGSGQGAADGKSHGR